MTKLLSKAFGLISKLSDDKQDGYATLLMDELAAEECWGKSFDDSTHVLSLLAEEALQERREGMTVLLDPENL